MRVFARTLPHEALRGCHSLYPGTNHRNFRETGVIFYCCRIRERLRKPWAVAAAVGACARVDRMYKVPRSQRDL